MARPASLPRHDSPARHRPVGALALCCAALAAGAGGVLACPLPVPATPGAATVVTVARDMTGPLQLGPAPAGRAEALAAAVRVVAGAARGLSAKAPATVVDLVNLHRRRAGCRPLAPDSRLDGLARSYSDDMATRGFFGHTDPAGRSPSDRARSASITYLGGENIARGQSTPEAVTNAWMDSPDHRDNILNCAFTRVGTGVHEGPGGPWWTQDFGY